MFLDKNIYKYTDFDKNIDKNNLVVNHIDNNKHNNNANNLEFCTTSYNNRYSKNKSGKRLKVYQYNKQGKLLNTYVSICEASRVLNINARSLNRHCHLNDEYLGYIFMLKEVVWYGKSGTPWTKLIVEEFIREGMLSKDEEFIIRTRAKGYTITQQADALNMSPDNISKKISLLKRKYDEVAKYDPLLPPRKISKQERYMDSH